jgi:transglutaminase-like putative cysteine protease
MRQRSVSLSERIAIEAGASQSHRQNTTTTMQSAVRRKRVFPVRGPLLPSGMRTSTLQAPEPATHLAATPLIDSDHPAVQTFVREHAVGASPRERAVSLYLAVRDSLRYDPYRIDLSTAGMRASTALQQGFGWCVPKAVALAAVARAAGIPARLGFADVKNHLSTERLRQTMGTDVFVWHGYTELWLDGAWRKATPAFNIGLCDKFGLLPLDFNGVHDSLYHPFDRAGQQHMEYVNQRGTFDDLPLDQIRASFAEVYPGLVSGMAGTEADFAADAEREAATETAAIRTRP